MNTCPKCGSPQESPEMDGTTARIWFTCGSYGYAHKADQVFRRSDKCLDREEINDLQAKLDASTIHSCGDSCSRPMCVLRRERDAYKEALEMIAYDGSFPKLDCQKLADATLTEIELSKEGEAK